MPRVRFSALSPMRDGDGAIEREAFTIETLCLCATFSTRDAPTVESARDRDDGAQERKDEHEGRPRDHADRYRADEGRHNSNDRKRDTRRGPRHDGRRGQTVHPASTSCADGVVRCGRNQ